MKAVTLNGIRDLAEGEAPLPSEAMAEDQTKAIAILSSLVRGNRTMLLRDTDWTRVDDTRLSAQSKSEFAAYRQSLRDIPEQPGFPFVTWPTAPTLQSEAGNETGEQS